MKMVCKLIAGCAALVLCMSSGTYFNVEASSIYGDVNNNGVVDISDVSALNLYLSGSRSASSINMRYADVDQNTVINSSAGITRYTGNGIVKNTSDNYFLDTEAYGSGGDSGGPMYIEYTLENSTFRSAIGIYKGHYDTLPRYSTGVRITTPILRFYMNNSHIG